MNLLNKMGSLVLVALLVFGTACEDGIDGINGTDGTDGVDGANGSDGSDGVSALVSIADAGDACANGGFIISVGADDNGNGTLEDGEVDATETICNGSDGGDGSDGSSVAIRTSGEEPGDICEDGGFKVETGIDDNDDGELQDSEVDATTYVCFDDGVEPLEPLAGSVVDANLVFDLNTADFTNLEAEMVMTSKDILPSDPDFVYGSYTDGCALYDNGDGTYNFVVNCEADFSVARIRMNSDLQPLEGDYIMNSQATSFTAQCSGSGIYPDVHGFGPLYLSGGEWGGSAPGVYIVDPNAPAELASIGTRSLNMGEWATENAVALSADAYDETVVIIGDDDSNNDYPESHLGMYVGARGDLFTGDLYILRGKDTTETDPGAGGLKFEMGMAEGTAYDVEWIEMTERTIGELNQEAIDSAVIGFQRIEDIDWQKGSADANRTIFYCVTGRYNSGYGTELDDNFLAKRGTTFGRIYMLQLNADDPTGDAKLTCILDGDNVDGTAWGFHSPDNIMVTDNYVYIQEDPNGYHDDAITVGGTASVATAYPKIYQYDITTGEMKTVMVADQEAEGVANVFSDGSAWEFTGMIDVTDIIGASEATFLCGVQVHDWESDNAIQTIAEHAVRADGRLFFDEDAIPQGLASLEGSFLFKITGLE